VAVSGGPDSLALLLTAQAACPGRIEAATVNHGLRPESAAEAEMVADLCGRLAVPHATLNVEVAPGNLQQQARLARYRALGDWAESRGLAALVTAHHADDQTETLLMRLNRASGLSGLAGVRERGTNPAGAGPVLRPLLGWRKAELEAIVRAAGIEPARDRALIRKALDSADWLDPLAIAQSAGWLGQAEAALAHFAAREWDTCVLLRDGVLRYATGEETPREIRLRILARAIATLGSTPRLSQVAELLEALERGEGGNLGGVLARVEQGAWLLRPEPPRR